MILQINNLKNRYAVKGYNYNLLKINNGITRKNFITNKNKVYTFNL